jgi:Ca-activated chloride channel family protein
VTRFANPALLFLLLVVPLYVFVELRYRRGRRPAVRFPDVAVAKQISGKLVHWKRHSRMAMRALVLTLLVFALARPQAGSGTESVRRSWPTSSRDGRATASAWWYSQRTASLSAR